jgi:hypothetical protein
MASMPYLAEFLSEKLLTGISFFEPLRGVVLAEAALPFAEANANNLGELVGGALSLINGLRTEANLLPPSLSNKRELAKRLPWLAAAAVTLLIALASWYGYALNATSVTLSETAKINSALADEGGIAAQIENHSSELEVVQKTSTDLLSLVQLRDAYPAILADLSGKIPSRFLWITEIQPVGAPAQKEKGSFGIAKPTDSPIKAISVKGLYLNNPRQAAVIDDFVTSLQSSDIFAVDEKEKSKIITQRGSPNGDYWAYPFALVIPLRNPLTPLP